MTDDCVVLDADVTWIHLDVIVASNRGDFDLLATRTLNTGGRPGNSDGEAGWSEERSKNTERKSHDV